MCTHNMCMYSRITCKVCNVLVFIMYLCNIKVLVKSQLGNIHWITKTKRTQARLAILVCTGTHPMGA